MRGGSSPERADRDDLADLLGAPVDDVGRARRELCARIRDGGVADGPTVAYCARDWARRTQLLRPAMGSLADRRYSPLPP